jgi:hypothetical protein
MSIPSQNDIMGTYLLSKASTDSYRDNWESIFGKKAEKKEVSCGHASCKELGEPHMLCGFVSQSNVAEKEETVEKTVAIPLKDLLEWRQGWMDANDPCDGEDCVSPFDKYLYGE